MKLWFLLLLDRLGIKKFHRTTLPGALGKLFKPSLRKDFEESFKNSSIWRDER